MDAPARSLGPPKEYLLGLSEPPDGPPPAERRYPQHTSDTGTPEHSHQLTRGRPPEQRSGGRFAPMDSRSRMTGFTYQACKELEWLVSDFVWSRPLPMTRARFWGGRLTCRSPGHSAVTSCRRSGRRSVELRRSASTRRSPAPRRSTDAVMP